MTRDRGRGRTRRGGRAALAGWLGCAVLATGALPVAGAQPRAGYEAPPTLAARELAPHVPLEGPGYRVDDAVPTDGFLATFTIRSDYGVFTARGPGMLEVRLREVAALRQLEAMSRSEVFVEGLKGSAAELGRQVTALVTSPVETVRGMPEGIGRFFERVGRGARTGVQRLSALRAEQEAGAPPPAGPGAKLPGAPAPATGARPEVSVTAEAARATGRVTRDAFGYDDRRRELAKQVGVDPYTTNPVLAKQLDDIAWAAFTGGLGITALKAVVPASLVISTSTMLTDWVYDVPPGDLKVRNERALLQMGVSQEAVDHLLRHRWYTLTLQTGLVRGLERLAEVAGRPEVMALALTVASEEQARFVVGTIAMLARHHEATVPLARLEVRGTVIGRTRTGGVVVAAPVDVVAWTERLHHFASRQDLQARERSLWLSGQATPLARQRLAEAGWTLHERTPAALP